MLRGAVAPLGSLARCIRRPMIYSVPRVQVRFRPRLVYCASQTTERSAVLSGASKMNTASKLSLGALLTAAAFAASAAVALAAPAVTTGDTQLRDDADFGANWIETIYAGEHIDVQDCSGKWCYVDHDGNEGWIRKSKLAFIGFVPHPHPHPVEPAVGFGVDVGPGGGVSFGFGLTSY